MEIISWICQRTEDGNDADAQTKPEQRGGQEMGDPRAESVNYWGLLLL